MRTSNYTFLHPKNYRYINPIKGLQGCGVGYRFAFNGQEKDDEVFGDRNSIEFKFRIYEPRLGRFSSLDPLSNSFPWNSPYSFAENRVIDGNDLEGKEWERKIAYDIASCTFDVELNVKLQVINFSKVTSDFEAIGIMGAMQKQVGTTFTQMDKDRGINYSTSLEYEFINEGSIMFEKPSPFLFQLKDVNSFINKDGLVETTTGETVARPYGSTKINRMMAGTTIDGQNRSLQETIRTATHEVGHSAGLEHPWDISSGQEDVNQNKGVNKETIKKNIMNSDENEVNPSSTGTEATPDQLLYMTNSIGNDY